MKKEKKSRITREEKKELVEQTLKKNPYVRLVDQIRQNKVAFVVILKRSFFPLNTPSA